MLLYYYNSEPVRDPYLRGTFMRFNPRRGIDPAIVTSFLTVSISVPFICGTDIDVMKTITLAFILTVSFTFIAWLLGAMSEGATPTFNPRRGIVPAIVAFVLVSVVGLPFIGGTNIDVLKTTGVVLILATISSFFAWLIASAAEGEVAA